MQIEIEADLRSIHIAPESMHVQLTEAELAYFDEELPLLAAEEIQRRPRKEVDFSACFADSGPANTRVFHLNKGLARRLHANLCKFPSGKALLSVSVCVKVHDGIFSVIPVIDAIFVSP